MGSWNETCCISNMPILQGDRAVYLPIVYKNNAPDGIFYHTTDIASPLPYPLKGTYDDYGSLENIDTSPGSLFLIAYIEEMLDCGLLKYSCKDIEKTATLTHLRKIERGGATLNGLPIGLFPVLEPVWNTVITELGQRIPYKHKKTYRQCLTDRTLKKLEEVRNKLKNLDLSKDDPFWEHKVASVLNDGTALASYIQPYDESIHFGDSVVHAMVNSEQTTQELLPETIDMHLFMVAMRLMRKLFIGMQGKGSQCSEYDLQAKAYQAAAKIKKIREDKWGGDEPMHQEGIFLH